MKIGFDGWYARGDLVGVGKYIANLISQIAEKGFECVIFYPEKPRYPISGRNISLRILPSVNHYTREQIEIPIALRQEKIDLYHATGNMGIPLLSPVPSILTVHDIIPLVFPGYFKQLKYGNLSRYSYLFRLKTSLSKAKNIISVSKFTKKTLVDDLGINPDKINVVYSGEPKVNKETNKLPKGLKPGEYVLNHGGVDIRKNVDRLIRAFEKIISKTGLTLVITGSNKRMVKNLKKEVQKIGIEESVVFTGYVKEKTLWSLIRQANCICYPSLIEGFGGPILEGFAAGVPVITSNTSSLLEISSDAAYLVSPEDEKEIAQAILKITRDRDLRRRLIERGRHRLIQFSWKKTTEETIKIYEEVLK